MHKIVLMESLIMIFQDLTNMEKHVREEAKRMGVDVYSLRLPDGSYVLAPILVAQVSALSAFVSLLTSN